MQMQQTGGKLPEAVHAALVELRVRLLTILGDDLLALWTFGSATYEDRPKRFGDVDSYAVLRSPLKADVVRAVDDAHESTARECRIEWDSWYVLELDVRSSKPPSHALRGVLTDHAWALHRAHWFAGHYVVLHGPAPEEFVPYPTWPELAESLREELHFIARIVELGPHDAEHAAFVVWQCCRIVYSMRTRDVVISKRAAAQWALEHMPESWHAAIHAAERTYDGTPALDDRSILVNALVPVFSASRDLME